MTLIEQQILAIVDREHGAYWSDFSAEIDAPKARISAALRRLVTDKVLRQKDDDQEHDWEYVRQH